MRIVKVELYELTLPFVEPFIISGGRIDARRSLIIVLHDDEGHTGYGESPPFELPFYSEETLASARDLIGRVLLPRIVQREFASLEALDGALREGVRGNPFARAGVETAAWDLEAHARGTGLARLLAGRLGVEPAAGVPCGVALGFPEDGKPETLTRRVYDAVRQGYRRVKIKVMPGWDEVAVRAARAGMAGTDVPLTVDANGAYAWPEHERPLRALDVASLPLCVYPSDLEPSARWYGRGTDVVKLTMGKDGRMAVPGVSIARLLDTARFRAVTQTL